MKNLPGKVRMAIFALSLSLFLDRGRSLAAPPDLLPVIPTAQAWEFADLQGVNHKIDWLTKGQRGVLVFFFDAASPDSLLGLTFFDALFKRAADFGLAVVCVEATGRQDTEVKSLLQNYAAVYKTPSFPVIADPDFVAAKLFDSHRAPTTLLIGERGRIVARRSVFDLGTAAALTRLVEQLLRRSEGFFSPALRDVGLSELRERQLSARAAAATGEDLEGTRALGWGGRLPAFEFTDTAGRVGRWAWHGGVVIRVAFFWSGGSPSAAEDLVFFQRLQARSGGENIEIIAVESTGMRTGLVTEILKDFTRTHSAPAFPVIPDPEGGLVALFGAGDPLPQTFLVGGQGEVLYRADGLDARARLVLEEKVDRAVLLVGLREEPALRDAPHGVAPAGGGAEAPSIRRQIERDEALRFNLSSGDYFFSNGQHERALLYYQRYLELEPTSLHALVRLAQIYDLVREPVKAREFWERVLAISPGHGEARARLKQMRGNGSR